MHPNVFSAAFAACEQLGDILAGANYAVSLDLNHYGPGVTPADAVATVVGPRVMVREFVPVTLADVLDDFERCVRDPGDSGAGPDRGVIGSRRFQELVCAVAVCLEQLAAEASLIAAFEVRDTSPYYGIHWAFRFVLHGPAGSTVFTGWSSD